MPENHVKPTKAELKAGAEAAAKALENPPADPPQDPPQDPPTPPVVPPVTPPQDPPQDPPVTPPAGDPPVVPPVTPPATPPVDDQGKGGIDYRKRYADSSREAQRLSGENKEIKTAINEAATVPEPTVEELTAEYSDFADMTPTEQRFAKESFINKKRFEILHTATSKITKADEWNDKVIDFVEDPKVLVDNPDLEGKQEEFRLFATAPERRGNDFATLLLAFAGEQAKKVPVQHKGQMFPTGQGGGGVEPAKVDDGKISAAEGRLLMKNDYPKFKEMLKAGKIRNE